MEEGQHIILFGERGVGKTSLANIVSKRYIRALTPDVTCNANSTLFGIWKNALERLPYSIEYKKSIGFQVADINESDISVFTTMAEKLKSEQDSMLL